jgi:hypothetical protein
MDKLINSKNYQSADRFGTTKATYKNRSNSFDQIQTIKEHRNTGKFGENYENLIPELKAPLNQQMDDNNSDSMSSSVLSSEKDYDENDVIEDVEPEEMNFVVDNDNDA